MAEEEQINTGRRMFLKRSGSAVAGVAASAIMPAGAAQALASLAQPISRAAGLSLDGMRFEVALDALLEDMFIPTEQLASLKGFLSSAPTAQDAYEFARNFGSPTMFKTNMQNMLDFVADTAHELDAAKALNPTGVSNFLSQIHRPEIHEQFHHVLPDSTGEELVAQLRTTIAQDAHAYSQTQQSVVGSVQDTYARLRTQFAGFGKELEAGETDYARDVAGQSHYYGDMPSARKAGGYPIPAAGECRKFPERDCRKLPESYVGDYESSGEHRSYLGTVEPIGIDIIKT